MLEVVIAAGIFALLCILILRLVSGSLHFAGLQAQRDADAAAVGELADRWRTDEDSAWAIFTPPTDVNGASNADGHELDFFTRDGKNRSYFWAYTYDAPAQTLTRYLYPAPGAPAVKDETFSGVTKFLAHTYPVTALQDQATPVYSPLYQSAVLQPGAVRFYPSSAPWINGGNQITYVRVETASQVREIQLATQTAPSGFTVVLRYSPTPVATTGPLVTLGKIVFEPSSLAFSLPAQRIARGLNALLGGAQAQAQSVTCAYAQLFLQDGSADANEEDGFNTTDARGCVTDGEVRLWATEANYAGLYYATFPRQNSCLGYAQVSPASWSANSNAVVTPTKGTLGCAISVSSSDKTPSNGGAANVVAVVDSPPCSSGITCYSSLASSNWRYFEKCNGGGAQGPPCPTGGNWFYTNSFTVHQFSSVDGGNSWTDLGSRYDCSTSAFSNSPGGLSCTPAMKASPVAYSGSVTSTFNAQTGTATGPAYSWSPSNPPATP